MQLIATKCEDGWYVKIKKDYGVLTKDDVEQLATDHNFDMNNALFTKNKEDEDIEILIKG